MQPHNVTWAVVVLASVQAVQVIITGWFAWSESRCRQQLRLLKHEIANMRHDMYLEGVANRQSIDRRNATDGPSVP